jgi:hypothetical protein
MGNAERTARISGPKWESLPAFRARTGTLRFSGKEPITISSRNPRPVGRVAVKRVPGRNRGKVEGWPNKTGGRFVYTVK